MTLYLHGILLPWDLFIAERSALKRASRWSLKQMIMLSGSQDISNLVSGDLVIAGWSADNLVNTNCLEISFGTVWKVFLRAFGDHLDCQNWSSIPGVIVWMKFVTHLFSYLETKVGKMTAQRALHQCSWYTQNISSPHSRAWYYWHQWALFY